MVGLAHLREERATELIAKALLARKKKWGGVERHLIASLATVGGQEAVPALTTLLTDGKTTQDGSLHAALTRLTRIDHAAAAAAAAKMAGSEQAKDFSPELRAKIRSFFD